MDHLIYLTDKQAEKLESALDAFYTRASESSLPPKFIFILGGIRNSVKEKMHLEQYQVDVIVWMLETIFLVYEEYDCQPLLEQCYFKLTGYWYEGFAPWYEREKQYEKDGLLEVWRREGT